MQRKRSPSPQRQDRRFFTPGFDYIPGSNVLEVYINGVKQAGSAYTESQTFITLTEGVEAGDIVEIVSDVVEHRLTGEVEWLRRNYGPYSIDPTQRPDGTAMVAGDEYFNSTVGKKKYFNGSIWVLDSATLNFIKNTIVGFDSSGFSDGEMIYFKGRDTVGDGGGGMFRYSASSTATVDNRFVFAPTGGGRLIKETSFIQTIIFDGDSITEGNTIGGFKYSEWLRNLSYCHGMVTTENYAIGGAWIPAGSNGGNNISDRYTNIIRAKRPAQNGGTGASRVALHILIGTNDLSTAYGNMSATTVIDNLYAYVTQARTDGFYVILGTILPRSDSFGWSAAAEAKRAAVNDAIKKGFIPADIVVDYASALTAPNDTSIFIDKVHPNVSGSKIIAAYLNRVLITGETDKLNAGDTLASPQLSGKVGLDFRSYFEVGKAYMRTTVGTDNFESTGFLTFQDLNETAPNVARWQFSQGFGGSGLKLQALNDTNSATTDMLKFSRTGLSAGFKIEFKGQMSPLQGDGWFQAGENSQKVYLGHFNGSGAGYLIFNNIGGGAADEHIWELSPTGGTNEWGLRAVNDAISAASPVMTFLRSGTSVTDMVVNCNLRPRSDNAYTIGSAAYRWSVVYAASGTINTSDETLKQDIRLLSEAEKRVAVKCKGLIRAFKYKDAVEKKGDGARIHVGVIAQEVKAAFESEGLIAEDYGILCYDSWDEQEATIDSDSSYTVRRGRVWHSLRRTSSIHHRGIVKNEKPSSSAGFFIFKYQQTMN